VSRPDADLLLLNGRFHTMDPAAPLAEAAAIRAGRFLFVGDAEGARAALGGSPETMDLGGRCAIPGLTDAHLHLKWYAESLRTVDAETATLEEAVGRVRARAQTARPDAWVTGWGWNHNVWGAGALPDRRALDAAAPRNPVALSAKSGHAVWASSLALRKAGIGRDTPDPEGGRIVRGADGEPTGILLENAMGIVLSAVPQPSVGELAEMMRDAQKALHGMGLTGVHDYDGIPSLRAVLDLEARDMLSLRVVKGIPHEALPSAITMGMRSGFGGERLVLGQLKMFADGALGPQTAWMLAPYEGSSSTGIPTLTEEQLFDSIRRANAAGIACAVHAIGDGACRAVLNAYARAAAACRAASAVPPRMPNRLEHAQLLHPDDVARCARLSVVASMQPLHATSDMLMADRYWGERSALAYAWKAVREAGAVLAFGSDCPVETADPFAGMHAAVTRRRADGSPGPAGWRGAQRLSVEQAVHAYTMGAALAAGRDRELGSLARGKLADLTVLDQDVFGMDPHGIRGVKPAAVIVGGVCVHGGL
jgi:predicted amidohydrolase YtcJ